MRSPFSEKTNSEVAVTGRPDDTTRSPGIDEAELRAALDDPSQFEVLHQPIVDLASGMPVGTEALVRWNHPDFGVVRPDEFIPLAESCGAIRELGRLVLDLACIDAQIVNDFHSGIGPLTVSVNVSSLQLEDPKFVTYVDSALRQSGLAATSLILEITEHRPIEDHERVLATMQFLKRMGIGFSLDDFGTGFNSLAYLHDFPFDFVKIDRKFIASMYESGRGFAVIEAVVKLSEAFGTAIVAEGIEFPLQAHKLSKLGCHRGQGYHFARPLGFDDLHDYLRSHESVASIHRGKHGTSSARPAFTILPTRGSEVAHRERKPAKVRHVL